MIKLFRKVPLSAKLTLIGIVPLLLLVYVSAQVAREKDETIAVLRTLQEEMGTSIIISELSTQLHLERRHTFSYLNGIQTPEKLTIQQAKTDATIAVLQKDLAGRFEDFTGYTLLSQLDSVRTLTSRRNIVPAQAMLYYSTLLMRLNNSSVSSAESAPYLKSVGPVISGHRILSQMANNLGQVRAVVYSALLKKELSQQDLFSIESIYSTIASQERELQAKASPEVHQDLIRVSRTEAGVYTVRGIRNIIRRRTIDPSVDAEQWWATSAKAVDNLKSIQLRLEAAMQQEVDDVFEAERQERNISIALIALGILIVILLIVFSIRSISTALSQIQSAAERLARGETGFKTEVETRDAIGSLAISINQIETNNKQLSKAAESIGAGNFDIHVDARSEGDTLGNAIILMKTNLQAYNKEQQETAWIQRGIRQVNECLLGDKPLETLNQDAMNTLAAYLQLELALFYVSTDTHTLQYCCGYAVGNSAEVPAYLNPGETMVGQAALSKELIHLEDVPEDFMKITSGAGSSAARHVLIVPLVYNHTVEGVMELASLKPISKASVSLVQQVSANIATAIQSAKNKARLQELLEETQSQAEELQAQHSELEGLNSELEAQASQLQASEEELRVQQEELLQANQELEERSVMLEEKNEVIERNNLEIRQKAEELALNTRYKSEFLANMSHELRTPLNSILLLSRLMYENEDNQLSEEQVEYAEIIQSSGKALLTLIDEILDLSKIEAGRMDLEYQPVSMDEMLRELRALFQPVAGEKKLDLQFIKTPGLLDHIVTDRMRLGQILKNLLSNALKFTAEGSVKLTVRPSGRPDHVDFIVSDTGIGIPRDKQDLVFEAFQQADGSTKRRYGGTGLGLSISRELSRLLGGHLALESEPEQGSTFTLTIPTDRIQTSSPPEAAAIRPAGPTVHHNGKAADEKPSFRVPLIPAPVEDDRADIAPGDQVILIIEDDTAFATALLKFSNQKGFKGIICVRGDEGIRMAREVRPKAILLDIKLPVKDGWEVMNELKTDPATRHIPVHIMSSEEYKKESLHMGAVDFLSKPVGMEQMHQIFRKLNDVFNRNPKKVLIVEENPKHAQALHYFLSNFNVSTEVRGNMEDGMETLTREDVDCVILDMGIPDQHAYKTLEILKQSSGMENLPIIVFTGKSLSQTEESRIRQYADTIVLKTAQSYKRILDEVALFLHLVEDETPKKKSSGFSLGGLNEVLHNKKVLIADDDVRNIFSLTKALEIHKMTVLSATDGQEALQILAEHPDTDVILMDMMMPAMDGYETIQRIRKDGRNKDLPILAVTAKAMLGDREKCINAGASDYISKPVDIDQLVSLLRVWLYDKSI